MFISESLTFADANESTGFGIGSVELSLASANHNRNVSVERGRYDWKFSRKCSRAENFARNLERKYPIPMIGLVSPPTSQTQNKGCSPLRLSRKMAVSLLSANEIPASNRSGILKD